MTVVYQGMGSMKKTSETFQVMAFSETDSSLWNTVLSHEEGEPEVPKI